MEQGFLLGLISLDLCCFPFPGLENLTPISLTSVVCATSSPCRGHLWVGSWIPPSSRGDPETLWAFCVWLGSPFPKYNLHQGLKLLVYPQPWQLPLALGEPQGSQR